MFTGLIILVCGPIVAGMAAAVLLSVLFGDAADDGDDNLDLE
jgi:hypothetical protein